MTTPNDSSNARGAKRRRRSALLDDTSAPLSRGSDTSYLNQPTNSSSDRDLAALLSYGPSYLPFTAAWTDSRIEQVRAYKHWVYVAIRAIARKVASSAPNITYVHDGRDKDATKKYARAPLLSPYHRAKALAPLLAHEELEPVGRNHPLLRLLLDPNDPDTAYDLFYETILFLLLTGSAYWWIPRDEVLGLPCAIWCLPSHWVWPVMGKDRLIDSWELRPIEGNYLRRRIPADEVILIHEKNPISKIDGFSPLTAGAQWTDIQTMNNTARWWAYKHGTFPTVAVQFDGTYDDPSDEDLRRIEAKFISRYVGDTKSNKPLFLPPGVKVSPLTIEPNKMVFGETAKETRDNILALFGVPPVIAGLSENLTAGGHTAAQNCFCTQTINPLFRFLGQILTEKLARIFDETLRVWWEDATPEDPTIREEQIKTDLLAGAITVDEIRLLRGRQPYPESGWGSNAVVPVNMTVVPIDKPFPIPPGGMPAKGDNPTLPTGGDSTDLVDNKPATQPGYSDKE